MGQTEKSGRLTGRSAYPQLRTWPCIAQTDALCQNRTLPGAPLALHFEEAATTNSAVSVTFDVIEFEMKH